MRETRATSAGRSGNQSKVTEISKRFVFAVTFKDGCTLIKHNIMLDVKKLYYDHKVFLSSQNYIIHLVFSVVSLNCKV